MENPWKDVKSGIGRDLEFVYEFGPFRLNLSEGRLYRGGEVVPLTPKVFKILVTLIEENGRLVEKGRLMTIVWPDTYVEESNLTANISILRKALGESRNQSQYIETVPTRGYRFIAPVVVRSGASAAGLRHPSDDHATPVSSESSDRDESRSEQPVEPRFRSKSLRRRFLVTMGIMIFLGAGLILYAYKRGSHSDDVKPLTPAPLSIAILPFQSYETPADEDYLSLGLADAIICELSHYKGLVVRPPVAIRKFQAPKSDYSQIGRELGVDLIVTGAIQREGECLRVTMLLIQVGNNEIIWSDRLDGRVNETFALGDAISRKLAMALVGHFPDRLALKRQFEGHSDHYQPKEAANQALLKGRKHLYNYTLEDWRKSLHYLTEATRIDPQYAMAYASLAEAYTIGAELYLPPREAWPLAQAAAERAIALDGNLSEAYKSLAIVKALYRWDWNGAEEAFERAIALSPQLATARSWYGWCLLWQGQFDKSMAQLREAQRLDPASCFIGADIGTNLYCQGQHAQAETELKKFVEMDPNCFSALAALGWVYLKQSRFADAVTTFEKTRKIDNSPMVIASLAHVKAQAGDRAAAESLLAELRQRSKREYVSPFAYVLVYQGLGDKDQTFFWLERSYESRTIFLITLKVDPIFESLRDDPRYADLLSRLNLASS